jgi:prophage antirepressor-like protein
MSAIIDVFNNLLKYNQKEIFIVVDKNNQIWFKLKDIVKLLGYNDHSRTVSRINISNKFKFKDIKVLPSMAIPLNFQSSTIFIDESGLYKLLTNSKKELAQKFRDDIFSNILPTIRKTGKYNIEDKNKLKELNKEIIELKNNQRNIKYPIGKAIYVIKKVINNKKYYKLGYTRNLNKRLKVYNTGNPNKLLYKYFCIIDDENLDKCIKNFMKNKEYIKNKEFYVTKLSDIITTLNKCDNRIKYLTCGYCLKSKKLTDMILHKCKFAF